MLISDTAFARTVPWCAIRNLTYSMNEKTQMINVTAAILVHEKKVLIARRGPGGNHPGKWEFPGGKVENGESPEACLARELKEEFDIAVEVENFFAESTYTYDHGTIRLLAYRTRWCSGVIRLLAHDRVAWVAPEDLPGYDLLPADVPLAERLGREIVDG